MGGMAPFGEEKHRCLKGMEPCLPKMWSSEVQVPERRQRSSL